MIGLLQRVRSAYVQVDGQQIASIEQGVLALIGIQREDRQAQADRLLDRILGYRLFEDTQGKMNLSLLDIGGGLLLVPQFTLAADTHRGMRASFTRAASPDRGQEMFEYLLQRATSAYTRVQSGWFGANMQVGLVNDGPVTFWLEVKAEK